MIAKIISGNKPISMVLYNENKVIKGDAIRLSSQGFFIENAKVFTATFSELIKESDVGDTTRHISLSLPPGENCTPEQFSSIAKDYLSELGYGQQPYVVYLHQDRPHAHIHIVTVNIDAEGKKISDFYEKKRSQQITRKLEVRYNLTPVDSFKTSVNSTVLIKPDKQLEYKDLFEKKGIGSLVGRATQEIKENYRPTNYSDIKRLLEFRGIEATIIQNEDRSVKGVQFGILDQPNIKPIFSSDLYHNFSNTYLEKVFASNIKFKDSLDTSILEKKINNVLKTASQFNTNDFTIALKARGVEPVFDRYKDGKVYGLSFLDIESGCIFKATEINRKFSYNQLSKIISNEFTTDTALKDSKALNSIISEVYFESYNEWKNQQNRSTSQSLFIDKADVSNLIKEKLPMIDPELISEFVVNKTKNFMIYEAFSKLLNDQYRDIAHELSIEEIHKSIAGRPEYQKYLELVGVEKVLSSITLFKQTRVDINNAALRRPAIEQIIQDYKTYLKEKLPDADLAQFFVGGQNAKDDLTDFIIASPHYKEHPVSEQELLLKDILSKAIWDGEDKGLADKVKRSILKEANDLIKESYNESRSSGQSLGDYYRLLLKGDNLSDKMQLRPEVRFITSKLALLDKPGLFDQTSEKVYQNLQIELQEKAENADRSDLIRNELQKYYALLNTGDEKIPLSEIIENPANLDGFKSHLNSLYENSSIAPDYLNKLNTEAEKALIWDKDNRVVPLKIQEAIQSQIKSLVDHELNLSRHEKKPDSAVFKSLSEDLVLNTIFKNSSGFDKINDFAIELKFPGDLQKLIDQSIEYAKDQMPGRYERAKRQEFIKPHLITYYEEFKKRDTSLLRSEVIENKADLNEFFERIKKEIGLTDFTPDQKHLVLSEALTKLQFDKENRIIPLKIEESIQAVIKKEVNNGKIGNLSNAEVYRLLSQDGYLSSVFLKSPDHLALREYVMNFAKVDQYEQELPKIMDRIVAGLPKKADETALTKFINTHIQRTYNNQFKEFGIKKESVYINTNLHKQTLMPSVQQIPAVQEALKLMASRYPEFDSLKFLDDLNDRFITFKHDRLIDIMNKEDQNKSGITDVLDVFGASNTGNNIKKKKKKGRNL